MGLSEGRCSCGGKICDDGADSIYLILLDST